MGVYTNQRIAKIEGMHQSERFFFLKKILEQRRCVWQHECVLSFEHVRRDHELSCAAVQWALVMKDAAHPS